MLSKLKHHKYLYLQQIDAIPTCVCEKTVADKVEKTCLKCGGVLGGGIPGLGLIGGTAVYAAAVKAATKAGMEAALDVLERLPGLKSLLGENIKDLVTTTNFKCPNELVAVVQYVKNTQCGGTNATSQLFCSGLEPQYAPKIIERAAVAGTEGADAYIRTYFVISIHILYNNMCISESKNFYSKMIKHKIYIHINILYTSYNCIVVAIAPQNYDNDPEMKSVMQQFHDRTTQRFQEYDERLQEKRQICKDTCDKEIQKIILKDKLEKELTEKFATLQTDIHSDAIPTCVCEKSVTDKFEKTCLKCGNNMGGLVPGMGLIGGTAVYAAAVKAATKAGMKAALDELNRIGGLKSLLGENIKDLVTTTNFKCPYELVAVVQNNNTRSGRSWKGRSRSLY
ncbi:hypothetical protein PFTANZ_06219 [Plasmodium falciparum Tanzania (2000708)]|uniref:Surface antigen n=1 Tax=Plasmodium falciparum Tanzania (2000708) TaxID=1036725 RepID=A0A024VWI0_PLAFA|nr:hypothetical protein PFTANZ_06219 [Plasmodium falciparum Tanzania (2000708)]